MADPIRLVQLKQNHGFVSESPEDMYRRLNVRLITREEYKRAVQNGLLQHSTGFPICLADTMYDRSAKEHRHGFFVNPAGQPLLTALEQGCNWRLRPLRRGFRRPCWRFAVAPLAESN